MNRSLLSERILEERIRNHLTQEELACRLGVSKAAVSKWECGQNLPDIALVPQIASLFSVTLDDLFGYEPLASEEKREEVTEWLQALLAEDPAQAATYAERQSARYWSDPELLKAVGLALYVKAIEPSISDEANCPEPTSRVADLAERILRRVLQLDPDGPSTGFVLQALCILLASEGREGHKSREPEEGRDRAQAPAPLLAPRSCQLRAGFGRGRGCKRRGTRRYPCSRGGHSSAGWVCGALPNACPNHSDRVGDAARGIGG